MAKTRNRPLITDVVGSIRRGIKAIGDPVPPPSLRELARDPFSEVTRKERRALLALSILGILIGRTGMMPTKIESVGITINADQHAVALYLLVGVIVYFLFVFLCYSVLDYITTWEARAADRENRLSEQMKTGHVMLPHPRTPALLILTRRFRYLLDFWLPIALGVWAIVEVVVRTRHL
jgi:hypothetical protein